jgi:hypothetical protein
MLQGPTLTALRSANGCVFGGFAAVAWASIAGGVDVEARSSGGRAKVDKRTNFRMENGAHENNCTVSLSKLQRMIISIIYSCVC